MIGQQSDPQQVLVRFQDQTKVFYLNSSDESAQDLEVASTQQLHLLQQWSLRTGWPVQRLQIRSWDLPFVDIAVKSCIVGGKGGFGTLLKGQSRQAGAKLTTDFGACRDLQGRRLRHVNDEIKLRKWKEIQKREQAGEKVADDELWNTPSGIYNWHLMTPTWADISKKATYRIKRQFQQINKEAEKKALQKKEKDELYQNSMTHYMEQATSASESIQKSLSSALQQGLAAKAAASKKRRRSTGIGQQKMTTSDPGFDDSSSGTEPNSLVTLSGDLIVEQPSTPASDATSDPGKLSTASSGLVSGVKIQSQSDFGTAVLVLEGAVQEKAPTSPKILYYEVTVVTGGLAQIGWASLVGNQQVFEPNDALGDGVGDDGASFGVDGSRGLKFHAGKEEPYPNMTWKEGDIVGCHLDLSGARISFSINGKDCGTAFDLAELKSGVQISSLVPAFSSNRGQILQLHTTKSDCKYFPKTSAAAVGDLLVADRSNETSQKDDKPAASIAAEGVVAKETSQSNKGGPDKPKILVEKPQVPSKPVAVTPKALNLDDYSSVQDLEALGLDRLKAALLALQVKCGGSLTERAVRLFSLKGLARKDYPPKVRAKGFIV